MDQPLKPCTPIHVRGRVPPGVIAVNVKWKGSILMKSFSGKVKVFFDSDVSIVDFHPSNDIAVLHISEHDMVAGTDYKKRIVKLRKVTTMKGIVLAEKTELSQQYCQSLQKFVVVELGLVLLFVSSAVDTANLLIQMVIDENKPYSNPFLVKRKAPPIDVSILSSIKHVPKLGGVRAKALLIKCGSIKGLSKASTQDLAEVVGHSTAQNIYAFFHDK